MDQGQRRWLVGRALRPTDKFIIYTYKDFPSPSINFVHGSHMYGMNIIEHVAAESSPLAAALGPLACHSRRARVPYPVVVYY